MKPLRLKMSAFGPYAEEEIIDFSRLGGASFFLIHGPTGSGKSSVLDAICFALYGVCSGPDRSPGDLRCQTARLDVPTSVTLDFGLRGRQYRITRNPEYEAPKKRGEGTTVRKPEATLHEVHAPTEGSAGPEAEVLCTGVRQCNEEAEKLLGFKADEFRQVMILPQGDFRKLLMANSKERSAILETLFRTHLFTQIQERLKARAKDLRETVQRLRDDQSLLLQQAGADDLEKLSTLLAAREKELLKAQKALQPLKETEGKTNKTLQAGRKDDEAFRQADSAAKALKALELQVSKYEKMKASLQAARKAQQVLPHGTEAKRCEREAERRTREHEKTVKSLEEKKKESEKVDGVLRTEEEKRPEREEEAKRLAELRALEKPVREIEQLLQKVEDARGEATHARDQFDSADKILKEQVSHLEELRRKTEELEPLAATATKREVERDDLRTRMERRSDLVRAEKDKESCAAAFTKAEEACKEAKDKLVAKRAKLEELQRVWDQSQAQVLAHTLRAGKPCPVCGSVHHPAPALGDSKPPLQGDLIAARDDTGTAEAGLEELTRMRDEARSAHIAAATRLGELHSLLGDDAKRQPAEIKADLDAAEKKYEQARQASEELSRCQLEVRRVESHIPVARTKLESARVGRDQKQGALREFEVRLEETTKSIPEDLRSMSNLHAVIEQKKDRIDRMDESLRMAQEHSAKLREELSGLRTSEEQKGEEAAEARGKAMDAGKEFVRRLEAEGFAGETEYEMASANIASIETWDQDIHDFDKRLHAAKEKARERQEAIEGKSRPDIPALEKVSKEARKAVEEQQQAIAENQSSIAALTRMEEQLQKLRSKEKEGDRLRSTAQLLADVADGQRDVNPGLLKFKEFVLLALLDDVLRSASRRLEILSRNRYRLHRKGDQEGSGKGTVLGGRSSSNLDIEVEDSYTGNRRPAGSLSGGEMFLASLSLALGLADTVQNYAGGMELGTLFIDEGFGSLDQETLDEAIKVLLELQRGSKLVGIISHVRELRDCIDVRLEISPAGRGGSASAKFHVP